MLVRDAGVGQASAEPRRVRTGGGGPVVARWLARAATALLSHARARAKSTKCHFWICLNSMPQECRGGGDAARGFEIVRISLKSSKALAYARGLVWRAKNWKTRPDLERAFRPQATQITAPHPSPRAPAGTRYPKQSLQGTAVATTRCR